MKHLLHGLPNKIKILPLLFLMSVAFNLSAQAPQAFKYQAVVRHANGQPISSEYVSVRISILAGSFEGVSVYSEVHNIQTSTGGLITLNIGEGLVQPESAAFDQILWSFNQYYIKVDVDPEGGTDFLEMGTSQLLSVPYALYAKESGGTPSMEWDDLNGASKSRLDPAPGSLVYVTDRNQMAYYDGSQWKLLVGCPDNTIAGAGDDQLDVIGNTVTLSASTPGTDNTGTWSVIEGSDGSFSNPNDPSAIFTGIPGSTYMLRWTVSTVCDSNADSLIVSFCYTNTIADAGPDQLDIIGNAAILQGNEPGAGNTGLWSIQGIGGILADASLFNSSFTGIPGQTYILTWTITSDCEQNSDSVIISFCHTLTTASAGDDQTNISGTSVQLSTSVPGPGNTGLWEIISGTGGSFTNPTAPATQFSGQSGGTYLLKWTISADCDQSSSDSLTVSFCPILMQANAGPDNLNACIPHQLGANNPGTGNTGTWSKVSGAGGSFSNVHAPNATFTGIVGSTYQLRWTISNACGSTQDNVTIKFEPSPTVADAGADQLNIAGTTATLNANFPSYGTGLWTVLTGQGGSFLNASNPQTTFTGQPGIQYTLAWTISNVCNVSTTDNVIISFCPVLVQANAGPDNLNACIPDTLGANNPGTGNTGTWSKVSGTGGSFSNVHDRNATFTGLAGATYQLRWTISNACGSTQDEVTIKFEPSPTVANAGPDQTIEGNSTALEANMPEVGTGLWTIVSGSGGIINQPQNPLSEFTGAAGVTYQLKWEISNVCYSNADIVNISFIAGFLCGEADLVDPRDGQVYPTVQIGGQCWMAKNLNVGTMIAFTPTDNGVIEKFCYGHNPANCEVFGGLYRWDEMMNYESNPGSQGICPPGWYVPTRNDFQILIDFLGGNQVAGGALKEVGFEYWYEPNTGATNSSGFSARGGGHHANVVFSHNLYHGRFWSSNLITNQGYYLLLANSSAQAGIGNVVTTYSQSLRCIKSEN